MECIFSNSIENDTFLVSNSFLIPSQLCFSPNQIILKMEKEMY